MTTPKKATAGQTLTAREMEVAVALAVGKTNREIADDLRISTKTVDTHRGNVLAKLALRNNVALAHFAVQQGWIELAGVVRVDPTATVDGSPIDDSVTA